MSINVLAGVAWRRCAGRLMLAALCAVMGLEACGSGHLSEHSSAKDIVTAAAKQVQAARSIHVSGNWTDKSSTGPLDGSITPSGFNGDADIVRYYWTLYNVKRSTDLQSLADLILKMDDGHAQINAVPGGILIENLGQFLTLLVDTTGRPSHMKFTIPEGWEVDFVKYE
jgi:hypothetical protein